MTKKFLFAQLLTWAVLVSAFLVLSPVLVHGQTVTNPTKAVFTVSADHAQVTRYELGWFVGAATDPVQVADLGTGTPAADNTLTKALPSYPIGIVYTAKVRAYVNTVASDWSNNSNPFSRTAAAPTGLTVIK